MKLWACEHEENVLIVLWPTSNLYETILEINTPNIAPETCIYSVFEYVPTERDGSMSLKKSNKTLIVVCHKGCDLCLQSR